MVPNQNIGVKGTMGAKKTGIIFNKEEIDEVIQTFSKETKIPVQEGILQSSIGEINFISSYIQSCRNKIYNK